VFVGTAVNFKDVFQDDSRWKIANCTTIRARNAECVRDIAGLELKCDWHGAEITL
jgi:hypothetical protein